MFKTLLTAGALLLAPIYAVAGECEFPFDDVLHSFATAGAPWEVIPEADLPQFVELAGKVVGKPLEGVTGTSGQPASDRTSGRDKDGGIGA